MRSTQITLLTVAILLLGGFAGWWLTGRIGQVPETAAGASRPAPQARPAAPRERPSPTKSHERPEVSLRLDDEAAERGALSNQRTLRFRDRAALEAFLESIEGSGIVVLGQIRELNLLRLGLLDPSRLGDLLDGSEELGYIYPVEVPGEGPVQEGAAGFGNNLLSWLGVDVDNSSWGAGVRVAVIDTGIGEHSSFTSRVVRKSLVEGNAGDELNPHGTAVAGLIHTIAPQSEFLSYQVTDPNGSSDSFTLARAIIEATNDGADVINISMGSFGESAIVENALAYAREAGIEIVVSAGNNGIEGVSSPASSPQTIAVGSVDANGEHLDFSNTGNVNITAPGLEVYSLAPGDAATLFSGTSASAPVVTGVIAALASYEGITIRQATERVLAAANEAGPAGDDPLFGGGILNVGRLLLDPATPTDDVAIASNYLTRGNNGSIVQVTVENRGNTNLVNTAVNISGPTGTQQLNISTLPAGGIHSFEIPVSSLATEFEFSSSATLSGGRVDHNPANNQRTDAYSLVESP